MYRKYLKYLILITGLILSIQASTQHTGEWLGAEIEFDLPKKFSLETSVEARALNTDGIFVYKYFTQLGLNYKVNKRFDLAFKYRFTWRLEENLHFYYRNKMMLDLKFDYPVQRFKFDYRARFQRITKTYINSDFDVIPTVHFRNKFELSYDIPKNPITPGASFEFFLPLNGYKQKTIDEFRIAAEVKYPLKKKQSITGGIMYVHEQFETQLSGIIFLLSYKINID